MLRVQLELRVLRAQLELQVRRVLRARLVLQVLQVLQVRLVLREPQVLQVLRVQQVQQVQPLRRARNDWLNSGAVLCGGHILSNLGRNARRASLKTKEDFLKRSIASNLVRFTCGKKLALTNNCNFIAEFLDNLKNM